MNESEDTLSKSMIRTLVYTNEPILAHGLSGVLSVTAGFEMSDVCTSIDALRHSAGQADVLIMDLTSEVSFAMLSEK